MKNRPSAGPERRQKPSDARARLPGNWPARRVDPDAQTAGACTPSGAAAQVLSLLRTRSCAAFPPRMWNWGSSARHRCAASAKECARLQTLPQRDFSKEDHAQRVAEGKPEMGKKRAKSSAITDPEQSAVGAASWGMRRNLIDRKSPDQVIIGSCRRQKRSLEAYSAAAPCTYPDLLRTD
jgi:hypothetical protein